MWPCYLGGSLGISRWPQKLVVTKASRACQRFFGLNVRSTPLPLKAVCSDSKYNLAKADEIALNSEILRETRG